MPVLIKKIEEDGYSRKFAVNKCSEKGNAFKCKLYYLYNEIERKTFMI